MNSYNKIVTLGALKTKIARLRRAGKKIAFTNGCFDILHAGHVSYLEKAKGKNKDRILVVAVNSDGSVRKIKGCRRPIVGERQRALVLAALACVDYVTIFREETPLRTIQTLKPDVLVKGADWKGKEVVGAGFVGSYGGKIELVKYLDKFSTTNVIRDILKKCAA